MGAFSLDHRTAYQYRNLLGGILLLAKMMIIVNHDCHKYKYEFQKNLNTPKSRFNERARQTAFVR